MRLLFIAALVAASQAQADQFSDAYDYAIDAADRCESAWFQSRRERALDDLLSAGRRMALRVQPLGDTAALQLDMLSEITDRMNLCRDLVHSD